MSTLNDIPVTPRANRPSTVSDAYFELFFISGGRLSDAFEVCSVHVFPDTAKGDSSVWLDTSAGSSSLGLVASSFHASANIIFSNVGLNGVPVTSPLAAEFDPTNFLVTDPNNQDQTNSASSIFRPGTGHYGVVLRPGCEWNSELVDIDFSDNKNNTASGTGKYFDIWTLVDVDGSKARTFINSFTLYRGDVVAVTEPLLVNTSHRLVQKYVNKGSNEKLQFTTEHVVINRNISQDIKNIFMDSVIGNPAIRILKISDDTSQGLPYTLIKDWEDTAPDIQVDSSDTITMNWNTSGSEISTGVYQFQVSSAVLDNVVMSDKFNLVVR